ncbi:helix-turn-helix domain-containing protein [Methyloprofundus sedimenti]|nr:helix-turn-helix domain-containing protein [Methyloprofundus sedimenti]
MKPYRIQNSELQSLIAQQNTTSHALLPDDLGYYQFTNTQLDADLSYIETSYQPTKDTAIISQIDHAEPKIVVTLALQGSSRFAAKNGDEVIFKQGYSTITRFNTTVGERQYQADQPTHQLRLILNKNWLRRYIEEQQLEDLFKHNNLKTLSCQPMACQSHIAVQQLLKNNEQGAMRTMFMHTQAMNILTAELMHLFQPYKTENLHEIYLANAARDILLCMFKSPPTVAELAQKVGTNSSKLKKLFHQYFNTTPYGLLLDIRMEKAYQLLASTHCQVASAAYYVGYTHAGNFSTAFYNYFGITPKEVSRERGIIKFDN